MSTVAEKKTVMVVDDEEDIVDTLRDVFEDEGYDVATAPNGAAALSWLKAATIKPSVVVLDLLMPIMDGNALYEAMQRDPDLAKVRVVVSTSDPSRAPSGVLTLKKPVNLDLLINTVRKCC